MIKLTLNITYKLPDGSSASHRFNQCSYMEKPAKCLEKHLGKSDILSKWPTPSPSLLHRRFYTHFCYKDIHKVGSQNLTKKYNFLPLIWHVYVCGAEGKKSCLPKICIYTLGMAPMENNYQVSPLSELCLNWFIPSLTH